MKYYTDGFCRRSNPSPFGGGYTIVDENNNLIKREEVEKVGFTNNEAELLGVLEACKICEEGDLVSTDSMNTIGWIGAAKSKSRPDLNHLLQEARDLVHSKKINLMWERRYFNLAGIVNEFNGKERKKLKYRMNDVVVVDEHDELKQKDLFINSI